MSSKGSEEEGCGCAGSEFGCCPDGSLSASGENFMGCNEIPGEECQLPKDIGNCNENSTFAENYTRRWFFDLAYGGCSPFWWSGDCDEEQDSGIRNHFLDAQSCKKKCVEPAGSGGCYLPKVEGPGEKPTERWYYNRTSEQCSNFTYSGLLGNANNFENIKGCELTCSKSLKDLDVCSQPVQPGPCRGEYLSWFYDNSEGICKEFNYTGCMGNDNRFAEKEKCENSCKHQSKKILSKIICSKPKPVSDGFCLDSELNAKWFFNPRLRQCEPFYHGNCRPNQNVSKSSEHENMFSSQDDCEITCPNTFPPEIVIKEKVYLIQFL